MRDILKKLSLALVVLAAVFVVTGCEQEPKSPTEHTVTVKVESTSLALTFNVEDGETVESKANFPKNPTLNGYEFIGFYTPEGDEFKTNTPITKDITIIAKFKKQIDENTEEVVSGDGSKETTTTTEDEQGNTTVVVEKENQDGTKEKTTTTTTEDEEGNTTVVTEKENKDGTSSTTTETTDSEGNTTTTTVEKDEEGNVTNETSEVKPAEDADVEALINSGIYSIAQGKIIEGKACFEAAYKLDPNNDQAKVFSALADLASISTNGEIGKFLKDHVGIQNYPATMNALLDTSWLTEDSVSFDETGELCNVYEIKNETNNNWSTSVYRASRASFKGDDSSIVGNYDGNVYQKKIIDGKEYYLSLPEVKKYEWNINGNNIYSIFESGYYDNNDDYDNYSYYKIDGTGDYYVQTWGYVKDVKPIELSYVGDVEYTYQTTALMPVFDTLETENWFKDITKDDAYLAKLIIANIIKGNGKGLDSAIDDLYKVMFESKEYKSAIAKIDSVKEAVQVPSSLIEMFNLTSFYGEDADNSSVKLGKTELNLVKSLLNIYKGLFEYIQSYSFALELGTLTESNVFTMDWSEEDEAKDLLDFIMKNKAKIDPIASGFLTVRSDKKMDAAKATFASVIGDLIAAYDAVVGTEENPSIYPEMVSGYAAMGAIFREGAELLKDAIENGEKFYIPMGMEEEPESWPTEDGPGIAFIDMGKLFNPGQFAIDKIFDLTTINKKKGLAIYGIFNDEEKGYISKKIDAFEQFEKMDKNSSLFYRFNIVDPIKEITNAIPEQALYKTQAEMFNGGRMSLEAAQYLFLFWFGD